MSKRCEVCKCYRSRIYKCNVCGKKLCGCCSFKSMVTDKRCCCYPGSAGCLKVERENHKAALTN